MMRTRAGENSELSRSGTVLPASGPGTVPTGPSARAPTYPEERAAALRGADAGSLITVARRSVPLAVRDLAPSLVAWSGWLGPIS
jgi:hypothetical protein